MLIRGRWSSGWDNGGLIDFFLRFCRYVMRVCMLERCNCMLEERLGWLDCVIVAQVLLKWARTKKRGTTRALFMESHLPFFSFKPIQQCKVVEQCNGVGFLWMSACLIPFAGHISNNLDECTERDSVTTNSYERQDL